MQDKLKQILSVIDLTSLNDNDDANVIDALCRKAITSQGHVAAVCVYPRFVKQAAEFFAGKPVKIATVANFPQATAELEDVIKEIQQSIKDGAHEVDVVFPYSQYLAGDKEGVYEFIRACKAACGKNTLLKVILETGALKDIDVIKEVSRNVVLAGADFLKTSTGKIAVGTTPEAARAMLATIKELKPTVGFKASGGVRTVEQATQYIDIANKIMGADWVTPAHFRLGASQLVDVLLQ